MEIGFKARDKYSVSLMLDHVSKADIHSRNKGFDNVGLRQLVGLCELFNHLSHILSKVFAIEQSLRAIEIVVGCFPAR